ncbi:MAG TPA: division/cell wall cluster transcriptional repressor MraZ [Rubrivivax sp.]
MSDFAFKGGPVLTLDGKGRITVPARYRDVLMTAVNGQMIVSKTPVRCLTLFPRPVWDRFEAKLSALSAKSDGLRRLYIGSATEAVIDGASRVLLPPELRAWAGIERDVVFMGMGNRFELWDKATYDVHEAKVLEQDMGDQLADLFIG